MGQAKALQGIVGKTKLGKYPAVQGSDWSLNMFPEDNDGNAYMASVPGIRFLSEIFPGKKCRGTYVSTRGLSSKGSDEDLFVCMGGAVFRVDADGSASSIGGVSDTAERVCFAETGGERPLLLVADGVSLRCYDIVNGGTMRAVQLPERLDGSGLARPTHVAVVAGSVVINDTGSGYVYYSVPYPLSKEKRSLFRMGDDGKPVYKDDGLTVETYEEDAELCVFEDSYGVVQYFNGESSSDRVCAVYAVGSALYLFGPKSVETWQRGSSDYQTWVRTSYTINAANGMDAPYSVASVSERVFYVGSGESYGKAVLSVSGTSFEKVSPAWLDAKLLGESQESARGFCYSVEGHVFYVLQLGALGETWVYDASGGAWHERSSRDRVSGMRKAWRVGGVAWKGGKFYAFTDDGGMYDFSGGYFYEDFSASDRLPMVRVRQGPVIVDGFRPFVFEELAVECNVGAWDDYSLSPKLLLEVSRDGGETFGNVRSASLGRTGDYSHRVRFHGLGFSRLAVARLTYSHPTDFVISAAEARAESTGAML